MKSMKEITIPETTISDAEYAYNARQLGMAIVLQATKDYCKETDAQKNVILKNLRSSRMDYMSDGMSIVAADQLEKNPKAIAERLKQMKED